MTNLEDTFIERESKFRYYRYYKITAWEIKLLKPSLSASVERDSSLIEFVKMTSLYGFC